MSIFWLSKESDRQLVVDVNVRSLVAFFTHTARAFKNRLSSHLPTRQIIVAVRRTTFPIRVLFTYLVFARCNPPLKAFVGHFVRMGLTDLSYFMFFSNHWVLPSPPGSIRLFWVFYHWMFNNHTIIIPLFKQYVMEGV